LDAICLIEAQGEGRPNKVKFSHTNKTTKGKCGREWEWKGKITKQQLTSIATSFYVVFLKPFSLYLRVHKICFLL